MDARIPRPSFPDSKISETFLRFAAPMLPDLSGEDTERRVEEALKVAFTVWNAVVFADVLKDHRHLDGLCGVMADRHELAPLIEQMIDRKRALFGEDERLIGNWSVFRSTDGVHVRAEARNPHTLPKG